MIRHTASCRCGLIGAEAKGEPFLVSYCHCRDCRKQAGAPVMILVGFRDEDVSWQGQPANARLGGVERAFCAACGSQIGYRDERLHGHVYLTIGFMDEPERYKPTLHAFDRRRLPFFHIDDDLPRFDGFSVDRNRQDGT